MVTRSSVIAAAVAAGLVLFVVPADFRLPVAAAGAVAAFGTYALRERAALRGLKGALGAGTKAQRQVSESVERLTKRLNEQAAAMDRQKADLESARERIEELTGLHAAASDEALTRLAAQGEELTGLLGSLRSELDTKHPTPAETTFRQIEALIGLHSLYRVRAALPASRQWEASPDLLLHLTSLVDRRHPALILELGGGLSTVWLAYAVEKAGEGRIVSLEHDRHFAARTREMLAAHGLDHLAEVRLAPLHDLELDGEIWPWYDTAALDDLDKIELLVVDGPPGALRERARFPALPVLEAKLTGNAIVVVDDCVREDERDIIDRWRAARPGWKAEVLEHEKLTTVLSR